MAARHHQAAWVKSLRDFQKLLPVRPETRPSRRMLREADRSREQEWRPPCAAASPVDHPASPKKIENLWEHLRREIVTEGATIAPSRDYLCESDDARPITGAAKFDFGASRPRATRQKKESRVGQTCDNPHAQNPWSPSPQRVVRESRPNRPPPPARATTWPATESLTRDSGGAWNCQETTKKAGVLRDAKRRLSEFTFCGQFPNQTEKLSKPHLAQTARESPAYSVRFA